MKYIRLIDNSIAKVEEIILIVLLIIMLGLGFLQVVLRNLGSGINGADIFLRHSVLWIGLIGASLATKSEKHINMDALSRVLSPGVKNKVDIILNLIAALFSALFVVASYLFVKDDYLNNEGKPLFLNLPSWIVEIILPIAFVIITFRFLVRAIEKTSEIFNKEQGKVE
jgi:TRAP-type C4-dicarboxylate transport system permease small subunit